eukprot:10201-Heterococcus_DN1.PRE.3
MRYWSKSSAAVHCSGTRDCSDLYTGCITAVHAYCEHSLAQVNTKVCTISSPLYVVVYAYGTCTQYSEQYDTCAYSQHVRDCSHRYTLLWKAQSVLCAAHDNA